MKAEIPGMLGTGEAMLALAGYWSPSGVRTRRQTSKAWPARPSTSSRAAGHRHAHWWWVWQDIPGHILLLWAQLAPPAVPEVCGGDKVCGALVFPEPQRTCWRLHLLRLFSPGGKPNTCLAIGWRCGETHPELTHQGPFLGWLSLLPI